MLLSFTKMQALGNDFVILETPSSLTPDHIRWIADRRQGVGCDQVIVISSSTSADAAVAFFNADGSTALACGNGTRCVAKYLGKSEGTIQTPSFLSHFWVRGDTVTISLKEPLFTPSPPLIMSFPRKRGSSYSNFPLDSRFRGNDKGGDSNRAHYIDLGNPHLVVFTEEMDSVPFEELALSLQPPTGVNVELAQVISPTTVKTKVWERGVGLTPACGSGACAVGILSLKLGFIKSPPVFIDMEGGTLEVIWKEDSPPLLTGPAAYCFKGTLDLP